METEFEKIRQLGKKHNVDSEYIEKMIEALDRVYQSAYELELSTKDDLIQIKFKNNYREI